MSSTDAAVASIDEKLPDSRLDYAKIDAYAFGRTIEELARYISGQYENMRKKISAVNPLERDPFAKDIGYYIAYMNLVAGRLKGTDSFEDFGEYQGEIVRYPPQFIREIEYVNDESGLENALEDLEKLKVESLSQKFPEWSSGLVDRIRIGNVDVPFTPRIRALFNHPALSRLARVSQLGLVTCVYPASRHSRLEHSMGTYALSCNFVSNLWNQKTDPVFKCVIREREIAACTIGSLFHDLGQYPHCHDIEDALPRFPRHEEFGREVYYRKWKLGNVKFPSLFDLVCDKWGRGIADNVSDYLGKRDELIGERDPVLGMLWDVISSAFDVDKLDYVQRDSLVLGVAYGTNIESSRLETSLIPIVRGSHNNQIAGAASNEQRAAVAHGVTSWVGLGVSMKGVLPAQTLVVAREQMYERVYWHKTVRSFKTMLATALRRGIDKPSILRKMVRVMIFRPEKMRMHVEPERSSEAFHLVDSDYVALLRIKKLLSDKPSRYLIEEILNRRPYSPILDLSTIGWETTYDRQKVEMIFDKLSIILSYDQNSYHRLEEIRRDFQSSMLMHRMIKKKSNSLTIAESKIATEVCLTFDVPNKRGLQSKLFTKRDSRDKELEIDLAMSEGGLKQGWATSRVPRIYLHPMFDLETSSGDEIIEHLRVAVNKNEGNN